MSQSGVRSLPSRLRGVLVLFSLLVLGSTGFSNIRELQVADGVPDQQRVQSILLNNGLLVFVWEDAQSAGDSEIRYRVFDPKVSQFSTIRTANADSAGDQVDPVIAPLFNGGFAIAFASRPVGGDYDVRFRRFDFTGAAVDVADVEVNVVTGGGQQHPSITGLDNGHLVIAFSGPGDDGQDLFYRRFDANSAALDATDMSINLLGNDPVKSGDQAGVKVDAFPEGGWMAAFEDRQTGDLYGVRFQNDGTPLLKPLGGVDEFYFGLNENVLNEQFEPTLAAFGDEQFAVAFNSDTDGTATGRRVLLRVFDSSGPVTGDIQVGSTTGRSQDPHVALISSTRMAVAWKTLESNGSSLVWSVYVQEFDLNGSPQGAPLFLHADQSLDRGRPHVIPWSDGGFVVSWETGGAGGGVAARTVAPTTSSPGLMSVLLSGSPGAYQYRVSFLGFAGECYQLEAADVLNNWSTILTTNAPGGNFVFDDPDGPVTPRRFFRVKRKL